MTESFAQTWRDDALCREVDSETFFVDRGASVRPAKRICGMCTVRAACLAEALALPQADDRFGIFGGTTPRERVKLRQQAARRPAPVITLAASAAPERPRRAA